MDKQRVIESILPYAIKYSKNTFPSVNISQFCLETGWATSKLFLETNNGFGIKAREGEQSKDFKTLEDLSNQEFTQITAGFKVYESVEGSFYDHQEFFTSTPWRTKNYQPVINAKDAYEQCRALSETGYATDSLYANKLMNIIDTYDLTKYDTQPIQDIDGKPDNVAIMPDGTRIVFQ